MGLLSTYIVILLFYEAHGFQQNWLKVITKEGNEFSVTSRQCFGGIWTRKSIQAKCICVSGIWAISKEFCDTDFEILTGDQHCFPVNRPIRKFSYIGPYWNQPRWFGSYIFRKDMPYVARFNRENSEYFLNDAPQYLMRVNTSSAFVARHDRSRDRDPDEICNFGARSPRHRISSSPSIEIFKLKSRNTFKLGPKNQCFGRKSMDPIVTLKPGQSWRPMCGEVRQSISIYPNCGPSRLISKPDASSSTTKKPVLTTRPTKPPQIHKPTRPHSPILDYNKPTRPHSPILDYNKPTWPHTPKSTRTHTARPSSTTPAATTRRTTQRTTKLTTMAPTSKTTTKYKILFWNPIERPPKPLVWKPIKPKPTSKPFANQNQNQIDVDYEDDDRDPYWEANFPAAEKNQLILEQTRRMLRMHLNFFANPGSRAMLIDKEEFIYLRIAKNILLKTCPETELPKPLVNSVIRLFRYALYESMEVYPYTEFTDANENSRINASLIQCYESAHKMSFVYNSTSCSLKEKEIVKVVHNNEEYNATALDGFTSGNSTTFDFVIESVWKIMVHAHYYCAKNFAKNPADLSALMVKWEAFFSPVLKYRWANPEGSRNLFRAIFPRFNLNTFEAGLSKCLATANALSHYPVWIQRPILKTHQRPKISKRRGKRSKPRRGQHKGQKGEGCPPDHWDNQGHCLQKFFDPVRKYGARAPEACLSEYNGRHDF